jgi:HD-GYP domain-containing protein (c-di-GMP phosphodiesterase class II)
MTGRVSEQLLGQESEIILSRALREIPAQAAWQLLRCGVDSQEALRLFIRKIALHMAGDASATSALNEITTLLNPDVPWSAVSEMMGTLGRCICEYLSEKGENIRLEKLYQGLMRLQSELFEKRLESEKARYERLRERQRGIDGFPGTIAATLDPATLAKIGLRELKGLVGAEESIIFSIDSKCEITPQFQDGAKNIDPRSSFPLEGEARRQLLDLKQPYQEDHESADGYLKSLMQAYELDSILLLPLAVRGRVNGIILLSDGPAKRSFSPDEVELANSLSSRIAVAMESARLHSREQRKIRETVALLEIARAVNSTLDLHEILDKAVRMTVDLCGVVMCIVYLLDSQKKRFYPGSYNGFIEDSLWEEERTSGFELSALEEEALEKFNAGEPVIMPFSEEDYLMPHDVIYEHGVNLILMFPLISKDNLTGMFVLLYPRHVMELEQEEIEVVRAIAAQVSLAVENAALYEDIEKSYFSTVKALAKAIEVKDPYTHGHSERVTEYALMIAEAMSLDEAEKQKLKYAATLHDIGKIGIAGRVLNKAGSLTDEEYTHVKTHPLLGDTIIEPVEFLQGPRPIILHHHERFDGRGYPDGLKGEDIPLCARILSVADAFEAMRSDRPYRRALPFKEAKKELLRNAGTQFDPKVVEVFVSILEKNNGDPIERGDERLP